MRAGVAWLRLGVEVLGAAIVGVGVFHTIYRYFLSVLKRHALSFDQIRISFARYLALALEFQLGADILSTAIAPSWEQIGKLGVIAIIRTALNYFLMQEMNEERARLREKGETDPDGPLA